METHINAKNGSMLFIKWPKPVVFKQKPPGTSKKSLSLT